MAMTKQLSMFMGVDMDVKVSMRPILRSNDLSRAGKETALAIMNLRAVIPDGFSVSERGLSTVTSEGTRVVISSSPMAVVGYGFRTLRDLNVGYQTIWALSKKSGLVEIRIPVVQEIRMGSGKRARGGKRALRDMREHGITILAGTGEYFDSYLARTWQRLEEISFSPGNQFGMMMAFRGEENLICELFVPTPGERRIIEEDDSWRGRVKENSDVGPMIDWSE